MKPPFHHTHPRVVTHDGVKLRLKEATLAETHEYNALRADMAQRAVDAAKAKAVSNA